jgi:ABC-type transport system involved in multi-copper enzyme maturation permease subunit
MFTAIVKKEILDALSSARFLITTLLCLVLIPLGVFVNLKDYQKRETEYRQAQDLARERLALTSLAYDSQAEGFRPPSVLGIFSTGLESALPNTIRTSREGEYRLGREQASLGNLDTLLFGRMDLLFNVGLVLSLLALAFSHAMISDEKEGGTLRFLLAMPVGRTRLLFGKLVGGYLVFLFPVSAAAVIAFALLLWGGGTGVNIADSIPSILVVLAATLIYLFALFCLGLLISTFNRKTATAALASLLVWCVLILAYPKIAPSISEFLYPLPNRALIDLQESVVRKAIEERKTAECDAALGSLAAELANLIAKGDPSNDMADPEATRKRWTDMYRDMEEAYAPIAARYAHETDSVVAEIEGPYRLQEQRQSRLSRTLGRFSPLGCYTYFVTAVCATGIPEVENLAARAGAFQEKADAEYYGRFIVRKFGRNVTMSGNAPLLNPPGGIARPQLPEFEYRRPALSGILGGQWPDIVVLIGFALGCLGLSHYRFTRYDAR